MVSYDLRAIVILSLACGFMGCTNEQAVAPSIPMFAQTTQTNQSAFVEVPFDGEVTLPADHGAHDEYQLEWWYITSVLENEAGTLYPFQFTLFRIGLDTPKENVEQWSDNTLWLGHASLHTPQGHYFEERFARGQVGNAGVKVSPFTAYIDDWLWQSDSEKLAPSIFNIQFESGPNLTLSLSDNGGYIKHQETGVSIKSANKQVLSYYYSAPFLKLEGTLSQSDESQHVNGNAWFDHEWSTELVGNQVTGWDWFSIHLNDGSKLMVFRLHSVDNTPFVNGTLITRDGEQIRLSGANTELTILNTERIFDSEHPVSWQLAIADYDIDVTIEPIYKKQYNEGVLGYYEGGILVSGSHGGNGFLELTGYVNP